MAALEHPPVTPRPAASAHGASTAPARAAFVAASALLLAASAAAGQQLTATPAPAQPTQVEAARPVAAPGAVVREGNARFTVLTPRLIRMEWAADGRFEDRPSLVFLDRRLPVPKHTVTHKDGWLVLRTDSLTLRYRASGRFTPADLEVRIRLDGRDVRWHPGEPDTANLRGTTRTLDGARGPVPLEPGLLSRAGWVVVDDSRRPVFDASAWPWAGARPAGARQDWYFFGYGHDYRGAVGDFVRVAGRIPMPPRFAFGVWWSRYWAYTDQEFMDLVRQFDTFGVPLDVLVIDMDWHQTFELRWDDTRKDQSGQHLGWTGYSWNPAYFPDPVAFLGWSARQGLRTPLNLHPAGGIEPWETHYPAMARAMGVDPESMRYIPFQPTDSSFVSAYFRTIIDPLEQQGVDFWWLDWQQWDSTAVPGLNPTWWLNYLFFTHMQHEAKARPLIFHRWGGLGNHRYQIGFSGDAYSTWEALAFEPYFTATAANVGFGYWSHDIGGHLTGEVSPELYTRWIQFGVFSPILRTHTTKNPLAERRIWAYPTAYFRVMRQDLLLRYGLIPYIYTAARLAYDTGVSIVHPLYYNWPDAPEAYRHPDEYAFGPDMIARPITAPMSPDTLTATQTLWLPPGDWYEWFTGSMLHGPATVTRRFALDQVPVYVRAGAIIPMATTALRSDAQPRDPLVLTLVPGDSGATRIYEDAGDDMGYQQDTFAWTPVRRWHGPDGVLHVQVEPVEGGYPGMPDRRGYVMRLLGTLPPARVSCNGEELPYLGGDSTADSTAALRVATAAGGPESERLPATPGWAYDGDVGATIIRVPSDDVRQRVLVDVAPSSQGADSLLDGVPGTLSRLRRAMHLLEGLWPQDWPSDSLVVLEQTGRRIGLAPQRAEAELRHLRSVLPDVVAGIRTMRGDSTIIRRAIAQLTPPW
jgi:Glycosyl hydrolases family 31 TIM-barrel domain/Glycosyl hydrolase family 31 C-terminal domain/Domain of unknown function (DUF5110)